MNGLIKQWGFSQDTVNVHNITLPISYTNKNYIIQGMAETLTYYTDANTVGNAISENQIRLDSSQPNFKPRMYWLTIGY